MIKLSPFIKDIALTTVTSAFSGLSIIILMRFLAHGLGVEEFGAYLMSRRVLSIVSPVSTLGIGVALARYIAISKDNDLKDKYFLGGLILGVVPGFFLILIGFIFTNAFTNMIFHDKAYLPLFMATLFLIFGYSFYNVLYSFYRGLSEMLKANLWQLGAISIVPIMIGFAFARYGKSDIVIFLMGVCTFATFIPLAYYSIRSILRNRQITKIKSQIKELLKYSVPRIPSGFCLAGIFFVGPFLAPNFGSLKEAGYLIIGQSIISIVENALFAFSIIALPKVAQIYAEDRKEFLKERITDIISLIFHFGLFITLQLLIWSDQIVLVWLGSDYTEATPLTMIMLLGLIPYLSYIVLRSIIDAVEVKAINTNNLYWAFGITLISSFLLAKLGLRIIGLSIGLSLGLIILGLLTVLYLRKTYGFQNKTFKIKECLLLNVVFAVPVFCIKQYWLISAFEGLILIAIALFVESIIFLAYILILRRLKVRWISELEHRIVRRTV